MEQNWFETFFDGLALECWRAAVTPEMTLSEADAIERLLDAAPGAALLDVPCGNGRHAIELARRGYRLTGLDISRGFIEEARAASTDVDWVLGDMRAIDWREHFDGAYMWGHSFGYFPYEDSCRFPAAVARALKAGARFILETGAVAESVLLGLKEEQQMTFGDLEFGARRSYDARAGRLNITYTFQRQGVTEVKSIFQYVHSAAEIGRMLGAAGFEVVHMHGGTDPTEYRLGARELVVTARRL